MFGDEATAVVEGLPSLKDSDSFFQTESTGPASASLQDMQQDNTSSDEEQAAAEDMDQADLPAPAPTVKQTAGKLTHS